MPAQTAGPPAWLRNTAVWVGAALAVLVLAVLGVAVLPGWWARLVGSWVLGVNGRGVPIGMSVGAVFTILPLGVGLLATRTGLSVRARSILIVIALLLLLPNVITLAVALGSGDARSALVIGAPGFRVGSVLGVALVVLVLLALLVIRRRSATTRAQIDAARGRAVQVGRDRAERAAHPQPQTEPEVPAEPAPGASAEADAGRGSEPRTGGELDQPHG